MEGSTMEERAALTDTLVKVFENEKLKRISIDCLWDMAVNQNKEQALLALRVLYAYTL